MLRTSWPCKIRPRTHNIRIACGGNDLWRRCAPSFSTATRSEPDTSAPSTSPADPARQADETTSSVVSKTHSSGHAQQPAKSNLGKRGPRALKSLAPANTELFEFKRHPEWPYVPPEVVKTRENLVNAVQSAIDAELGRQFKVKPFGSTIYGADTPDSDIDLVIFDPMYPTGQDPRRKVKKRKRPIGINNIANALRKGGFRVDNIVKQAVVPIVKFRHRRSGLAFDINMNERLGYYNTMMIRKYCLLNPLLPSVIKEIKTFAARCSWSTSINNYTLTIMTIGFFQILGLVPNLQKHPFKHPEDGAGNTFFAVVSRKKRVQRCDTRYHSHYLEEWKRPHTPTVDEVLYKFYRYWADEHNYEEKGISLQDGGVYTRQRKLTHAEPTPKPPPTEDDYVQLFNETAEQDLAQAEDEFGCEEFDVPQEPIEEPSSWMLHPLVVRDPFIEDKNLGKSMDSKKVAQFRADCRREAELVKARLKASEPVDAPTPSQVKVEVLVTQPQEAMEDRSDSSPAVADVRVKLDTRR